MKCIYVGIDLGTVNSCVAIWNKEKAKAEIFETDDGTILPSFVCYKPKSDGILIGKAAIRDVENFRNGIYDVKRFIGRNFSDAIVQSIYQSYPFNIQGNFENQVQFSVTHKTNIINKSPQEVSADILKYIKNCLDTHYDEKIEIKAVVTNPAYFNNKQRIATRNAAQNAGFTVLGLMKEPTAAAFNFFNCNKTAKGLTVVFDLGGGTFDVSIVEKNGSNIDVKCSDGDNFLGGRNFEEEILTQLLEEFKNDQVHLNHMQKRRLQESIKYVKEKLSAKEKSSKVIENFFNDDEDFVLKLTKSKFEQLNSSLFKKCIEVIDRCLLSNKIDKTQVKNVVMVGGSSKIPKIQEMVRDYFGSNPVFHWDDPDLSVALGAATFALKLADPTDYSLVIPPSLTVNEICTMSIGSDTLFDLFNLVIEKNTLLPIKKTITYVTSSNYQKTYSITWYEGNYKCASKNHYLGKIVHTNIPERKAGDIHFENTIEVDFDNILKITSKVRETNEIETLSLSLYKQLKDVKLEEGLPRWTQKDDEDFERIAEIKKIFYQYYVQFAFINNINCEEQTVMHNSLNSMNNQREIIKEINNFISKYKNENSNYIQLIKLLLLFVDLDIDHMHYLFENLENDLNYEHF